MTTDTEAPPLPRGFAVLYKPARGGERIAWLTVHSVPASCGTMAVEDALAGWPRWTDYLRRVSPGGRVTVSHITPAMARQLDAGELGDNWTSVEWGTIAPETRRLNIEGVPGDLYAFLTRSARERGLTLRAYVLAALSEHRATTEGAP